MMRYILILSAFFAFVQCENSDEKKINLNRTFLEGDLVVVKESRIYQNHGTTVKVFFNNPDFKLLRAYVDCKVDSLEQVDTINYTIANCAKKLYMEGDTVIIHFAPSITGLYTFPGFTLLYRDHNGCFFTSDSTFTFDVLPENYYPGSGR